MILVDTNVIVALSHGLDRDHERCLRWFQANTDQLLVSSTVVAEACYLLNRELGPRVEAAFLDSLGAGPEYDFQLVDLVDADIRRMAELVRQYADRELGGTDASLVALAERLHITTIATINLRDFANVQPLHVKAFTTVPGF